MCFTCSEFSTQISSKMLLLSNIDEFDQLVPIGLFGDPHRYGDFKKTWVGMLINLHQPTSATASCRDRAFFCMFFPACVAQWPGYMVKVQWHVCEGGRGTGGDGRGLPSPRLGVKAVARLRHWAAQSERPAPTWAAPGIEPGSSHAEV